MVFSSLNAAAVSTSKIIPITAAQHSHVRIFQYHFTSLPVCYNTGEPCGPPLTVSRSTLPEEWKKTAGASDLVVLQVIYNPQPHERGADPSRRLNGRGSRNKQNRSAFCAIAIFNQSGENNEIPPVNLSRRRARQYYHLNLQVYRGPRRNIEPRIPSDLAHYPQQQRPEATSALRNTPTRQNQKKNGSI